MKKYFLTALFALAAVTTAHAQAAKPAAKPAAAAPAAPATPWTGFFFGINGAYVWGTATQTGGGAALSPLDTASVSENLKGGAFGFQSGFDVQRGNAVAGFGLTLDFSNITGSSVCPGVATDTCIGRVPWSGSVTGRVGVAAKNTLLYVRGGAAFGHVNYHANVTATGALAQNLDQDRIGWIAGAGIEQMAGDHLGLFAEYNYSNYGTRVGTTTGVVDTIHTSAIVQAAMFGVNWRR